jgi:hypothetical protein
VWKAGNALLIIRLPGTSPRYGFSAFRAFEPVERSTGPFNSPAANQALTVRRFNRQIVVD